MTNMDDWVIICPNRHQLRKITKEVYTMLKSLRVRRHPDKTCPKTTRGKAQRGFDFLGFRITPTRIQPSAASVSRRDANIAQLYEQGASQQRIGQYLRRWLGWSIILPISVFAAGSREAVPLLPSEEFGLPVYSCGQTATNFARDVSYVGATIVLIGPSVISGKTKARAAYLRGFSSGVTGHVDNNEISISISNAFVPTTQFVDVVQSPYQSVYTIPEDYSDLKFDGALVGDQDYVLIIGGGTSGEVCAISFRTDSQVRVDPGSVSVNTKLNNGGICGVADGIGSAISPTNNLCREGTASPVASANDTWSWSCADDVNGWPPKSCAAPRQYSISYDLNAGSGGPTDVNVNANSQYTLPQTKPTRAGYTFTEWKNGADSVSSPFLMPAEDVTLVAQWRANDQTLTYDANGSTGGTSPGDVTVKTDKKTTLAGNTGNLTLSGFTFAGWKASANGISAEYSGGDLFTMPPNDATLYAHWVKNTYAVTGKPNVANTGSVTCSPDPVEHGESTACTAVATAGYAFKNFDNSANCTANNSNANECTLASVTAATTVTANFSKIPVINDVPTTAVYITENTEVNLADFSIADTDSTGQNQLTVTLEANGGKVKDANGAEITSPITSDILASLNAKLAGLTFTANVAGTSYIKITATDQDDNTAEKLYVFTVAKATNNAGQIALSPSELKENQTLTATLSDADGIDANTQVTYQWSIQGQTDATVMLGNNTADFPLTDETVGKTITVKALYVDAKGNAESVSATSGIVENVNDEAAVEILGTPKQGKELTAEITDADGVPLTGVTYQWKADGADIADATSKTYMLTQAEVGKTITVNVQFTDDQQTAENVTSAATNEVVNDNDSATISITGTAKQGEILTADLSDADGVPSTDVTYQWKDADNKVIATQVDNKTYTLTQAEVGKQIKVVAIYTDIAGTNEIAESALTAKVENVNDEAGVEILGTPKQGKELTAEITDADGVPSTGVTYQWKADGADIADATSKTYTLKQAEVGKTITVNVQFTDDQQTAEDVTSDATVAVVNDNDSATISITGTAKQGEILTADLSDLDGVPSTSVTYQWKDADNKVIATQVDDNTYTLTQAEVGKQIKVVAIYTDIAGTNEIAESALTGIVENVNDTATVTIEGDVRPGNRVTAVITDADGVPETEVRYTWFVNEVEVANNTDDNSLIISADYELKRLQVKVSFIDLKGNGENPVSEIIKIRAADGFTLFIDGFEGEATSD